MTESPPRPDVPPEEDADEGVARPFTFTPAPLPVAPWWAASTPDPTPPEPVGDSSSAPAEPMVVTAPPGNGQDILETASPSPAGSGPGSPSGWGQTPAQAAPADLQAMAGPPEKPTDQAVSTGPQPLATTPPLPAPAPPPGPSKAARTRKPRRKGLLVAVCVVLVLGIGVAVAAAVVITRPKAEQAVLHEVTAAGTAGGLRKGSTIPEASAAYPFIVAAARAGGVEQAAKATAVYRDPVTDGQNVLFLGGTASIGDPGAFLRRARPSTALKVAETTPGEPDGAVSCGTFAVLSATHLYCAWATGNSFGFVASNDPAGTAQLDGLAPLTTRMRADLEKRTN